MVNLPFFLQSKRSEESYEEIQGVKFFVHKGEKGKNALLASEQAKLDEISDRFSPGFTLVAKLARTISEAEKIKLTKAYEVITSSSEETDDSGIDYQEIRLKYASDIGEMSLQLDREASAKKMAVCTIAIANRCWQALQDELESLPSDSPNRSSLLGAIQEIRKWSDSDTESRLSWGYIEDVWTFIERQRNGGKDPEPAEKQEITEEEIKKASEEPTEPTGEKSSGDSKGSGRQKADLSQKPLAVSPSG